MLKRLTLTRLTPRIRPSSVKGIIAEAHVRMETSQHIGNHIDRLRQGPTSEGQAQQSVCSTRLAPNPLTLVQSSSFTQTIDHQPYQTKLVIAAIGGATSSP